MGHVHILSTSKLKRTPRWGSGQANKVEGTQLKMWMVLEPVTHLSSPVEAHIVLDHNVICQLWVMYLARWYQQVMQAIQEADETGSVIGP